MVQKSNMPIEMKMSAAIGQLPPIAFNGPVASRQTIKKIGVERIVDKASVRMREVLSKHEQGSEITMTLIVGPLGDVAFHSSHVKKS